MDTGTLTTILTTLVGAGVIGLFRLSRQVTQLDTAIRGINGDNGLVGTTRTLADSVGKLTDRVGTIEGHVQSLSGGRRHG